MLKPIPPDPEPSEQELASLIADHRVDGTPYQQRSFAEVLWKADRQRKHPDDFLVAFFFCDWERKDYLASPLWKGIRRDVLRAADHKCACCGGRATQVHHRDYRPRVPAGLDLSPLVALCASCHKFIHKDGPEFRNWHETEHILASLVARQAPADPRSSCQPSSTASARSSP
jgi:hypothetical protein